jgi:hypothetical protein
MPSKCPRCGSSSISVKPSDSNPKASEELKDAGRKAIVFFRATNSWSSSARNRGIGLFQLAMGDTFSRHTFQFGLAPCCGKCSVRKGWDNSRSRTHPLVRTSAYFTSDSIFQGQENSTVRASLFRMRTPMEVAQEQQVLTRRESPPNQSFIVRRTLRCARKNRAPAPLGG